MILNKDQAIAIRDIVMAANNVNINIPTLTFDDSDANVDVYTSGDLTVYTLDDGGFFLEKELYKTLQDFNKAYGI